jgi:hypothetical protein
MTQKSFFQTEILNSQKHKIMNWEQCRDYGLIQIDPINDNLVLLYYNPYSYMYASGPAWIHVEDARWQGKNLILKGRDDAGFPRVFVMDGFGSYRPI